MNLLSQLKGYRTYLSAAAVGVAAFLAASGLLTTEQLAVIQAAGIALIGAFLRASQPDKAADPDATKEHTPVAPGR